MNCHLFMLKVILSLMPQCFFFEANNHKNFYCGINYWILTPDNVAKHSESHYFPWLRAKVEFVCFLGGGDMCSWVVMNILLLSVLSVSTLLLWPCIKLGYDESDSVWLNKSRVMIPNIQLDNLYFLGVKEFLNIFTTGTKKPICFVTEPTNFSRFV